MNDRGGGGFKDDKPTLEAKPVPRYQLARTTFA